MARYFKQWYEIYSNDILYFSYTLQRGTIECAAIPKFKTLAEKKGIADPIDYFNSLSIEEMKILPQERRFFRIRMHLLVEECTLTMRMH